MRRSHPVICQMRPGGASRSGASHQGGEPEEPPTADVERTAIAKVLHTALLREMVRLAPAGGDHVMLLKDIAEALISVLADTLVAANQEDVDHLTTLFPPRSLGSTASCGLLCCRCNQ
jgi:hypothetical protein